MRLISFLTIVVILAVGCSDAANPSVSSSPPVMTSPPATTPVTPSPTPELSPSAPAVPSEAPSTAPSVTAWQKLEIGGSPDAREDHTWTVDPAAETAYLFGGRDGASVHRDLWAYDLRQDTWREVDAENRAPAARFGHEAAWVDGIGLVIWAGQAGPTEFFDDLWAYDPATNQWSRLPNDGARPVARYGSCSAIGDDGRLWISHGFTSEGSRFSDTRAYDFDTGRWTDETPDGRQPVVRCLHACWLTADGRFALYAGQTTGVRALGDFWALDDGRWANIDGDLPPERNLPAVTRHGDDAIVFGGLGLDGDYRRDVYRVDGTSLAFEQLSPTGSRPPGRSGATLIDDPARGRLLLFGGTNASRALDDTWQLDLP